MRARWTVALMLALAVTAPAATYADDRPLAREEFKAGSRYFEIGDYVHALEHFKTAYIAFEDPAILFNIAQCQRLMNQKVEALRSYRIYLQKRPETPNRDEIQKIIVTLEDAIRKDNTASSLPPTGVEGANNPRVEDKPAPAPEPAPVTAAPVQTTRPPEPEVDRTPVYKKWWLWAIVGGVVVAGVAVGVGVGVAANSHPDFKPTQPDVGPGASASRLVVGLRF